jgi:phosphopantothenoylcysteine decarboxylase / phosphopantothenate---cysteine ligase
MAVLTIRNLPDEVADALREIAARNGRSMEEQVRRILTEQVMDRTSALVRIDEMIARQARSTTPDEIDAAIEKGRG